ncbi:MAG: DUF2635 domain-containing protein [Sphingorhabdus sp.]
MNEEPTRVFVKPVGDVLVRHETGAPLKPEGEAVILTSWWQRREADGDIEVSAIPEEETQSAKSKGKS